MRELNLGCQDLIMVLLAIGWGRHKKTILKQECLANSNRLIFKSCHLRVLLTYTVRPFPRFNQVKYRILYRLISHQILYPRIALRKYKFKTLKMAVSPKNMRLRIKLNKILNSSMAFLLQGGNPLRCSFWTKSHVAK